jgi:hypothetical protein
MFYAKWYPARWLPGSGHIPHDLDSGLKSCLRDVAKLSRIGQGAIQYAQAGRVLQQVLENSKSLKSEDLLDAFKKVNIPFGDPNLYVAKPKGLQFAPDRLLQDGSAMFIQWTPEQQQQVVFPAEFAQTEPRPRV